MAKHDAEETFLQQRLAVIENGIREAIRREVERLRKQGLPVHIGRTDANRSSQAARR